VVEWDVSGSGERYGKVKRDLARESDAFINITYMLCSMKLYTV
jgi:hypothetical protein